MTHHGMTRRHYLAAAGAMLAAGLCARHAPRRRRRRIRQGYQTNMWGMPTYYLLRSGALEKRGIKFEEFAVPSGNLTMQQMVARQVDLGTYAGPSFILGHDKGGLVAIAVIEHVGRTARIMARKDLDLTKVERAQGPQDRQPDRLLGRQHLRRPDRAGGRPQEGRLPGSAHGREQHGGGPGRQDRRRHGQRRALQRHRRGRRARHHASWTTGASTRCRCSWPPRRISWPRAPDTVVAYLKAWLDVARDFKENPNKVADAIYGFYTSKGYTMSQDTFRKALATVDVNPGFPSDLRPYMQEQAEILLKEKKIAAIPDWSKALRPDFMEKARLGA